MIDLNDRMILEGADLTQWVIDVLAERNEQDRKRREEQQQEDDE